jgi:pyridoxamine 5'-phosphate oxidase
MHNKIKELRREFTLARLEREDISHSPFEQFKGWFDQAIEAQLIEPNAMTLATVDTNHVPDARIVLLKALEQELFFFYTNYESSKGRQLESNPYAALVFHWPELERQVRVRGKVSKADKATSEQYFHSRPVESQLGAWSSAQSSVIAGREVIELNFLTNMARFAEQENVPLPEFWGGYQLDAFEMEFWQGRENRLHDRFRYRLLDGGWQVDRLSP